MIDLCEVKVGSPIWGTVSADDIVELRLDCGDGGYLKLTPAQACEIAKTLNDLVDGTLAAPTLPPRPQHYMAIPVGGKVPRPVVTGSDAKLLMDAQDARIAELEREIQEAHRLLYLATECNGGVNLALWADDSRKWLKQSSKRNAERKNAK